MITSRTDSRKLSHSQNFLKGSDFVGSLIDKTNISHRDLVVEIGSGKGIITMELAKRADKVIGIEYDPGLAENLKVKFANNPNVQIVQTDFLKWNLPNRLYKVFSNIPFNMTADIVRKVLFSLNPPEDTYLILQDRAVERFIGAPVATNTQMSILLQPFYGMSILVRIDRRHFEPAPNVNAVFARFSKKSNPMVDQRLQQLYRDFVVYGFNQWQPTVLNAFRKVFTGEQLSVISESLGLKGLRPSEMFVDQWLGMFNFFVEFVADDKKNVVRGAEKRLSLSQRGMQKQHRTRRR